MFGQESRKVGIKATNNILLYRENIVYMKVNIKTQGGENDKEIAGTGTQLQRHIVQHLRFLYTKMIYFFTKQCSHMNSCQWDALFQIH